jgi:hypothetical protein
MRTISLHLTPKQACIDYIAPQLQYESLAHYRAAVCKSRGIESGLEELCNQVEDSVKYAFHGRGENDEKACRAAVLAAKREVLFLAFLHQHVVEHTAYDEQRLALLSELFDDKLALLVPLISRCSQRDAWIRKFRFELLKETATTFTTLFYRHRRTVRLIEIRYFDGKNILFNSSRDLLKHLGDQLDESYKLSGTLLHGIPNGASFIDPCTIRTNAESQAEDCCSDLADAAMTDALACLGDYPGARTVTLQAAERMRTRLEHPARQPTEKPQ